MDVTHAKQMYHLLVQGLSGVHGNSVIQEVGTHAVVNTGVPGLQNSQRPTKQDGKSIPGSWLGLAFRNSQRPAKHDGN